MQGPGGGMLANLGHQLQRRFQIGDGAIALQRFLEISRGQMAFRGVPEIAQPFVADCLQLWLALR